VPFIGTNPDRTYPIPEGLVPGAGAILAAIEAATDCQATIIGKPSPAMYKAALERMDIVARQAVVVGDRMETDIAGAQALGCQTAVVLSGVSSLAQAEDWRPPVDLIVKDFAALVDMLE
jgi:4-nitrophenyl phosphatase